MATLAATTAQLPIASYSTHAVFNNKRKPEICTSESCRFSSALGKQDWLSFSGKRKSNPNAKFPNFVLKSNYKFVIKNSVVEEEIQVAPGSVSVVLLAGGVGKRMGASMPKQYLPLMDKPIALHSFKTFAGLPEVGEIVVVCDPTYRYIFQNEEKSVKVPVKYALPGKERQDSTFNGLKEISDKSSLVAIHDSARPLVTSKHTKMVIRDAKKHGAASLGVPVKCTIKQATSDGFVEKTLDRKILWEIQTPQVIEPELLRKGFDHVKKYDLEVTDDVSIVEYLDHNVYITHGCYTNLKVTTPEDLLLADKLLTDQNA